MATIFADDMFKYIFVTEKYCILIEIDLFHNNFSPSG